MPIPLTNQVHDGCASPGADQSHQFSAPFRIWELPRVASSALTALAVCSPLLLASRPKTPLRVFCIAAFEFLARLQGRTLGKPRRRALALACDFGSLCDDYYDHRRLDATQYRSLRRELRQLAPRTATARYLRQLRQAERCRPNASSPDPAIADSVIAYRTQVLDLSLRWIQEISGLKVETAQFQTLLNLVGLMQILDDILDWKDDHATGCPSYVTAFLASPSTIGVAIPLRAEMDSLLRQILKTPVRDLAAIPFALAALPTWTLAAALLKLRFPR